MDDCDLAGILVAADQTVVTRAASDPAVIDLDQLQLRHREGPRLEALAGAGPVYSGDLGTDPRYPGFGPAAQAAGIRSALAYRLLVDGADGALNLYAQLPNAYGSDDRAKAAILAALAGTALSAAVNRRDAQARSDNLEQALLSREVIGQAQGILIERERITAEQAFDILRRASQHLNEKLRDLSRNTSSTPAKTPTPARCR